MSINPSAKLEQAGVWGSNPVEFERRLGRLRERRLDTAVELGRGGLDAVESYRGWFGTAVESGRSDIDGVGSD